MARFTCVLIAVALFFATCAASAADPRELTVEFIILPVQPRLLANAPPGAILVHVDRYSYRETGTAAAPGFVFRPTRLLEVVRASQDRPESLDYLSKMFSKGEMEDPENFVVATLDRLLRRDDVRAKKLLERMLEHRRTKYGETHLAFVASLHNLAILAHLQGQYDVAERQLEQCLELMRKFPSQEVEVQHHVARELNALASVHYSQGEFEKAIAELEAGRALYAERYHKESLRTFATYCQLLAGLDVIYATHQRDARLAGQVSSPEEERRALMVKAELLIARAMNSGLGPVTDAVIVDYQAAIEILRKLYPRSEYPKGHPELHRCYNNIAFYHEARREFSWAESYFRQTLEQIDLATADDPTKDASIALERIQSQLGVVLREQRKYLEAIECFKRAQALQEKIYPLEKYPEGHESLVTGLNDLSAALRLQGRFAEAQETSERSLALCAKLYRRGSPSPQDFLWMEALGQQALALQSQNQYQLAHVPYDTALAALKGAQLQTSRGSRESLFVERVQALTDRLAEEFKVVESRGTDEVLPPSLKNPRGWPDRLMILDVRAFASTEANRLENANYYAKQMLKIAREYYPPEQYPHGHGRIADALDRYGRLLGRTGEFAEARALLEDALAMREKIESIDKLPESRQKIAMSCQSMGELLIEQGDFEQARSCHERALNIRRELYDVKDHPHGHNELIESCVRLGHASLLRGDNRAAFRYFEEAERMWKSLYPDGKPHGPGDDAPPPPGAGHPIFTPQLTVVKLRSEILEGLGRTLHLQSKDREAVAYLEQALELKRQRFIPAVYNAGHPELAKTHHELGLLQLEQSNWDQAFQQLTDASTIWQKLQASATEEQKKSKPTPKQRETPAFAATLNALGLAALMQEGPRGAVAIFEREATFRQRMARTIFDGTSEAEALNFAAAHLSPPNELISIWPAMGRSDQELYETVWLRRGAIQQTLASRGRLLRETPSPKHQAEYAQYLQVRRSLALETLNPVNQDPALATSQQTRLAGLTQEKERLERGLAAELPAFRKRLESQRSAASELSLALPPGTVFVDFLRYSRFKYGTKDKVAWRDRWQPCYVAFLLRPHQSALRIDLGPAAQIDEALRNWREAIVSQRQSPAARTLRERVWKPIERHLPSDTQTVIVCPDSALTALPWAALPGESPESVLLEKYSFAVVPYGQFLLEQLQSLPPLPVQEEKILAIGDVDYSQPQLAPSAKSATGGLTWSALPETKHELVNLERSAGERTVVSITGANATPARVLSELPYVHWAHFATHGFFADPALRSALQIDSRRFEDAARLSGGERTTIAGRNPLVLSGLVLAGAGPAQVGFPGSPPREESGLLTAEAIAGMPLDNLRLVTLSACETGLGDVAGGEGSFGLQRAFHQAGARNVIATLWKVNDRATMALMRLFYHKLWVERKDALTALRESQLALWRHSDKVGDLAASRGPDFAKVVKIVDQPATNEPAATRDVSLWAGFVVSGVGR